VEKKLLPLGAAVAAAGLVLGLVVLAGGSGSSSSVSAAIADAILTALDQSMCQSAAAGASGLWSQAEMSNAETIVSVSNTLSGEDPRAAEIALMTAITESGLNDDPGGLGGAIGLFQQTPPAWGTATQILDPGYAAGAFVKRLLAVPGWEKLPPWQAAQAVQASGAGEPGSTLNPLPGQLGGNYEVNWSKAQGVYSAVTGVFTASGCGGGPAGGVTGPASRHGLPVGYEVPAGTPNNAKTAIEYAISKLGDTYVWGAAGPNRFDCSGLTMASWAKAGVTLVHYTVTQEQEGRKVPASQIAPGDLVLVPGSDPPGPGLPGHVGIYLGDSLVLSAIDQQYGVAVQSWKTFTSGGLDAVVDPTQPPA
jgi:cell wall-associated NlpC family hydrolase